MMTTAMMKKPMLAKMIKMTGLINDQMNDVVGFK